MKTNKTHIKIDDMVIDTYLTIFFEGNKEEVSIEDNIIYLWCKEEENFEYWIKLEVDNVQSFQSYLKNEETILNILKMSKINLCKRYYEDYNNLVFIKETYLNELQEKQFILPNDKAVLGYDFYTKYLSELKEISSFFKEETYESYNKQFSNNRSNSISAHATDGDYNSYFITHAYTTNNFESAA